MYDLSLKLEPNLASHLVNTNILKAKFSLYEICFQKIIEFITQVDPRISSILEGIHDSHSLIFKELPNLILQAKVAGEGNLEELRNEQSVKKQSTLAETEEVLEAAEKLEHENQILRQQSERLQAQLDQVRADFEEERASMQKEIDMLKEENERCI